MLTPCDVRVVLELVVLLLPPQELLLAARGGHVLHAHMYALPDDPVAHLQAQQASPALQQVPH